MNTLKTTTFAALVLAAGLALTGCSNTPDVTATSTPSVTVTDPAVAPDETQAPVEAPAPKTGDILTVAPTDLGPSQRAFPLPDGTFVMLDRYEPLPAGVQDILNAQATAAIPYVPNSGNTQGELDKPYNDATAFRSATVVATGKNIIVVYRVQGAGGCNGSGPDPWTYTGAAGTCVAFPSAAAAQAAAEANVAGRQDADTYIVVVKQG